MAFAWAKKNAGAPLQNPGSNERLGTLYKSSFSDGTKIEISFRSTGKNIHGTIVNDYISLFAISFRQ